MPQFSFSLAAIDVTTSFQPVFDGGARPIVPVSGANLNAIVAALDAEVIEFDCASNQVNQKLREACDAIIDALSPPTAVEQVFIALSRPTSDADIWKTTSNRVLHPSQNGTNVCVTVTGTGGGTTWRQVGLEATGGPV